MMPYGLDNLVLIEESTRRKVFERAQLGGGGVDSKSEGGPSGDGEKKKRKWGVGELEFEAQMRQLDNAVSVWLAGSHSLYVVENGQRMLV